MLSLGFDPHHIELILRERVQQSSARMRRIAGSIRSLAKYPPAFGLMGTVLGLVNLMRSLSQGMSAEQTGVEMSVALVATLYGLVLANVVLNPVGEMIQKRANEEEELGLLALQSVLLASDNVSLLESQEMLNSYVAPERRLNLLQRSA